jgi:hypothetical protein
MSHVKPVHHSSTWTKRIILKILSQQLHVPLLALIKRPAMYRDVWVASITYKMRNCQCTVRQRHVYAEPGDEEAHTEARKLNSSFERLAYVKTYTN